MKTTVKYNVTPHDGKIKTATELIKAVVETVGREKFSVDELIVEVEDVYSAEKPKVHVVNKSNNYAGANMTIS